MDWRSTCSMGWPNPRSTPSDRAATSSARRTWPGTGLPAAFTERTLAVPDVSGRGAAGRPACGPCRRDTPAPWTRRAPGEMPIAPATRSVERTALPSRRTHLLLACESHCWSRRLRRRCTCNGDRPQGLQGVAAQVAQPAVGRTIGLSCRPMEEAELLECLRSGDEAGFAMMVRTYQTRMLRLARGFVPSHGVAEEVVQDTWLGVVRGIERFEGRSSVATWRFPGSRGVPLHRGWGGRGGRCTTLWRPAVQQRARCRRVGNQRHLTEERWTTAEDLFATLALMVAHHHPTRRTNWSSLVLQLLYHRIEGRVGEPGNITQSSNGTRARGRPH